mgnify:CR=1 FL=1
MSVRKICRHKGCPHGDHRCSHPWWFDVMRHGVRFDGQGFMFTHDPDGNRVEFCTGSGYFPAPGRPA